MNHSIEFKCSGASSASTTEEDLGTHTNKIESAWRASKQDLPKTGTQKQLLQSYLWVYCAKKKYLMDKTCRFKAFIKLIKRVYPVPPFAPQITPRKESWIYRGKSHQACQTSPVKITSPVKKVKRKLDINSDEDFQ